MRTPPPALFASALSFALVALAARGARADDTTPPSVGAPPAHEVIFPFQPYTFIQSAISTSALLHADAICPPSSPVCPLGGGGGIFVGGGRRYARQREWFAGYDLSVRNARSLFSSSTLQQIRVEHRWILGSTPVHNFEGFVGVGGGAAFFGELLGVRTVGPVVGVSAGGSYNLSAFMRLGALLRLDATRFLVPFVAGDGVLRADGGVATLTMSFMLTATFLGH